MAVETSIFIAIVGWLVLLLYSNSVIYRLQAIDSQ